MRCLTFHSVVPLLGVLLLAGAAVAESDDDFNDLDEFYNAQPSHLTLRNDADRSQYCFNMSASAVITVLINQIVNGTNITVVHTIFSDIRLMNISSTCNSSSLKAMIFIQDGDQTNIKLSFNFTGTNKTDTWSLAEVGLNYTDNNNETENFLVKDGFDPNSQKVGFERFFRCSSLNISFFNSSTTGNAESYFPQVQLQNVSMQVFRFRNMDAGLMINGVTCQLDSNQGSKIVPIAVGAALACLIVIVLIAYLIGRFWGSRRSYERLS